MNTNIETVSTDQLRTGDVVHSEGMRLVIDQPITSRIGLYGDTVHHTAARIDNWNELTERADDDAAARIINSTAKFICIMADTDATGAHRWVIQGNKIALWFRETCTAA